MTRTEANVSLEAGRSNMSVGRHLEIMLIEDNPGDVRLIQEGLSGACKSYGLNVRVAEDGQQALEMLLNEGYRPDMILLDLNLPRVDGRTVLQRVRSHGVDLAATPVVVFSSSQYNIREILDAGASAFIVKPLGLSEYLRAIERFAVLWLEPLAKSARN